MRPLPPAEIDAGDRQLARPRVGHGHGRRSARASTGDVPDVSCIGVTVTLLALALPARATDCGLPGASSVTLNVALSLPPDCGVNVTATEHDPPTATARPLQTSLDSANAPAWAPEMATKATSSGACPVLNTDNPSGALATPIGCAGKVREDVTVTAGSDPPASGTDWGLVFALSVNARLPLSLPAAAGVKSTATTHVSPEETVRPVHPSEAIRKSLSGLPVTATCDTVTDPVPAASSVTVWAALVRPTVPAPKPTSAGLSATGLAESPLTVAVCGRRRPCTSRRRRRSRPSDRHD